MYAMPCMEYQAFHAGWDACNRTGVILSEDRNRFDWRHSIQRVLLESLRKRKYMTSQEYLIIDSAQDLKRSDMLDRRGNANPTFRPHRTL